MDELDPFPVDEGFSPTNAGANPVARGFNAPEEGVDPFAGLPEQNPFADLPGSPSFGQPVEPTEQNPFADLPGGSGQPVDLLGQNPFSDLPGSPALGQEAPPTSVEPDPFSDLPGGSSFQREPVFQGLEDPSSRMFTDEEVKQAAAGLGDLTFAGALGKEWGTAAGLQQKIPYYGQGKELFDTVSLWRSVEALKDPSALSVEQLREHSAKVVRYLNEKRLDEARERTLMGRAAEIASQSVPYGLEFTLALLTLGSSGVASAGVAGTRIAAIKALRSMGTKRLGELVGEALKLEAAKQVKSKLTAAQFGSLTEKAMARQISMASDDILLAEAKKKLATRILPGMVEAAAQTPVISPFRTIQGAVERQINLQAGGPDGTDIQLGAPDETWATSAAKSIGQNYLEVLTEMSGGFLSDMAKAAVPKGVVSAVANYARKVPGVGSVEAAFQRPEVRAAVERGVKALDTLAQKARINDPVTEYGEEWANATLNSLFNLDDDGQTPWHIRVLNSAAMPVTQPFESAAMLAGFSFIPAGSFAISATRGDLTPEERKKNFDLLYGIADGQQVARTAEDHRAAAITALDAMLTEEATLSPLRQKLFRLIMREGEFAPSGSMMQLIAREVGGMPAKKVGGGVASAIGRVRNLFNSMEGSTPDEVRENQIQLMGRILEGVQRKIVLSGLSGKTSKEELAAFEDLVSRNAITPLRIGSKTAVVPIGGGLHGEGRSGRVVPIYQAPKKEFDVPGRADILSPYILQSVETDEELHETSRGRVFKPEDFEPESQASRFFRATPAHKKAMFPMLKEVQKLGFRVEVARQSVRAEGGSQRVVRASNYWDNDGTPVIALTPDARPADVAEEISELGIRRSFSSLPETQRVAGVKQIAEAIFDIFRREGAKQTEEAPGQYTVRPLVESGERILESLGFIRDERGRWSLGGDVGPGWLDTLSKLTVASIGLQRERESKDLTGRIEGVWSAIARDPKVAMAVKGVLRSFVGEKYYVSLMEAVRTLPRKTKVEAQTEETTGFEREDLGEEPAPVAEDLEEEEDAYPGETDISDEPAPGGEGEEESVESQVSNEPRDEDVRTIPKGSIHDGLEFLWSDEEFSKQYPNPSEEMKAFRKGILAYAAEYSPFEAEVEGGGEEFSLDEIQGWAPSDPRFHLVASGILANYLRTPDPSASDEVLKRLRDQFRPDKVEFDEEKHEYRVDGRLLPSTTQRIDELAEFGFDPDEVAKARFPNDPAQQQLLKDSWKRDADDGSAIHAAVESARSGASTTHQYPGIKAAIGATDSLQGKGFLSELTVWDLQGGIAGTVDLIVVKSNGHLDLVDYKTLDPGYNPHDLASPYHRAFGGANGSKAEKHRVQLLVYKTILQKAGFTVDDLYVVPLDRKTAQPMVGSKGQPLVNANPTAATKEFLTRVYPGMAGKPEGKKPEGKKPEGKKPEGKKPEGKKPEGKKPTPQSTPPATPAVPKTEPEKVEAPKQREGESRPEYWERLMGDAAKSKDSSLEFSMTDVQATFAVAQVAMVYRSEIMDILSTTASDTDKGARIILLLAKYLPRDDEKKTVSKAFLKFLTEHVPAGKFPENLLDHPLEKDRAALTTTSEDPATQAAIDFLEEGQESEQEEEEEVEGESQVDADDGGAYSVVVRLKKLLKSPIYRRFINLAQNYLNASSKVRLDNLAEGLFIRAIWNPKLREVILESARNKETFLKFLGTDYAGDATMRLFQRVARAMPLGHYRAAVSILSSLSQFHTMLYEISKEGVREIPTSPLMLGDLAAERAWEYFEKTFSTGNALKEFVNENARYIDQQQRWKSDMGNTVSDKYLKPVCEIMEKLTGIPVELWEAPAHGRRGEAYRQRLFNALRTLDIHALSPRIENPEIFESQKRAIRDYIFGGSVETADGSKVVRGGNVYYLMEEYGDALPPGAVGGSASSRRMDTRIILMPYLQALLREYQPGQLRIFGGIIDRISRQESDTEFVDPGQFLQVQSALFDKARGTFDFLWTPIGDKDFALAVPVEKLSGKEALARYTKEYNALVSSRKADLFMPPEAAALHLKSDFELNYAYYQFKFWVKYGGNPDSYKSSGDADKRNSQTGSRGVQFLKGVEGGVPDMVRVRVVPDPLEVNPATGKQVEKYDGMYFFTTEFGKALSHSRVDPFRDGGVIDQVKAVASIVHEGFRILLKGNLVRAPKVNLVNRDIQGVLKAVEAENARAKKLGDQTHIVIFKSSAKVLPPSVLKTLKERGYADFEVPIEAWFETTNLQQGVDPKKARVPSQLFADLRHYPSMQWVDKLMRDEYNRQLEKLKAKVSTDGVLDDKKIREFLLTLFTEEKNPGIPELIRSGASLDHPVIRGMSGEAVSAFLRKATIPRTLKTTHQLVANFTSADNPMDYGIITPEGVRVEDDGSERSDGTIDVGDVYANVGETGDESFVDTIEDWLRENKKAKYRYNIHVRVGEGETKEDALARVERELSGLREGLFWDLFGLDANGKVNRTLLPGALRYAESVVDSKGDVVDVVTVRGSLLLINRVPGTGPESHSFVRLARRVDASQNNFIIVASGRRLKAGEDFDGDMSHVMFTASWSDRRNRFGNELLGRLYHDAIKIDRLGDYRRYIDTDAYDEVHEANVKSEEESLAAMGGMKLNNPSALRARLTRSRNREIGIVARTRLAFTWLNSLHLRDGDYPSNAFALPGTNIEIRRDPANREYYEFARPLLDQAMDNLTNIVVDQLKLGKAGYLGLSREQISLTLFALMNHPGLIPAYARSIEDGNKAVKEFLGRLTRDVYASPHMKAYFHFKAQQSRTDQIGKNRVAFFDETGNVFQISESLDSKSKTKTFLGHSGLDPRDRAAAFKNGTFVTGRAFQPFIDFVEYLYETGTISDKTSPEDLEKSGQYLQSLRQWEVGAQELRAMAKISDAWRKPPRSHDEYAQIAQSFLKFGGYIMKEAAGVESRSPYFLSSELRKEALSGEIVAPSLDMLDVLSGTNLYGKGGEEFTRVVLLGHAAVDEDGVVQVRELRRRPGESKESFEARKEQQPLSVALFGNLEVRPWQLRRAERASYVWRFEKAHPEIRRSDKLSERVLSMLKADNPKIAAMFRIDIFTGEIVLEERYRKATFHSELLSAAREAIGKLKPETRNWLMYSQLVASTPMGYTSRGNAFSIFPPEDQVRAADSRPLSLAESIHIGRYAVTYSPEAQLPSADDNLPTVPKNAVGLDESGARSPIDILREFLSHRRWSAEAEKGPPQAAEKPLSVPDDSLSGRLGHSISETSSFMDFLGSSLNPTTAIHEDLIRLNNAKRKMQYLTRATQLKLKAMVGDDREVLQAITLLIDEGRDVSKILSGQEDATLFTKAHLKIRIDNDGQIIYPKKGDKVKFEEDFSGSKSAGSILRRYETARKKNHKLKSIPEIVKTVQEHSVAMRRLANAETLGFVGKLEWIPDWGPNYVEHAYARKEVQEKPTEAVAERALLVRYLGEVGANNEERVRALKRARKDWDAEVKATLEKLKASYAREYESASKMFLTEEAGVSKERTFKTYREAMLRAGRVPLTWDVGELAVHWTLRVSEAILTKKYLTYMATARDVNHFPVFIPIRHGGAQPTDDSALSVRAWDVAYKNLVALSRRYLNPKTPVRVDLQAWDGIHTLLHQGGKRTTDLAKWLQSNGYEYVEMPENSDMTGAYVFKGTPRKLLMHLIGKGFKGIQNPYGRRTLEILTWFNALTKRLGIGLSFFHHFALLESYIAASGVSLQNRVFHPLKSYQDAKNLYRKVIENPDSPLVSDWVGAGLVLDFIPPDRSTDVVVDGLKWLSKATTGKEDRLLVKGVEGFLKWNDRFLWQQLQPTMKLQLAEELYALAVEDPKWQLRVTDAKGKQELREDIAKTVNSLFGGLNWSEYVCATPMMRDILQATFFAPDWTLSALSSAMVPRVFSEIFGFSVPFDSPSKTGYMEEFYFRKYWPAFLAVVLLLIPQVLQMAIYAAFGNPDDGDTPWMMENEDGKKMHVDVSPLVRALGLEYGKNKMSRVFLQWGKQGLEIGRWFAHSWESLLGKSSVAVKVAFEQLADRNTAGWDMPWAANWSTPGMMGGMFTVDDDWTKGRLAKVGEKFIPMSVLSWLQGRPSTVFAPTTLGKNRYTAAKQMAEILNVYADQGLYAKLRGIPNRTKSLEDLGYEVLRAANRNGVQTKDVMTDAYKMARARYYRAISNELETNPTNPDQKLLTDNARKILMLGGGFDNIRSHLESRARQKGERTDPKKLRVMGDAIREAHDELRFGPVPTEGGKLPKAVEEKGTPLPSLKQMPKATINGVPISKLKNLRGIQEALTQEREEGEVSPESLPPGEALQPR